MKLLFLALIVFILGGCDSYYKSGENPFDTHKQVCNYDGNRYDKTLLPPESFGKIGFASSTNEYPRASINYIDKSSNNKNIEVTLDYNSLCKSSKITKVLLWVSNIDNEDMLFNIDVPYSFNGQHILNIDVNKDKDYRCFYRHKNNYSFYSWARDEDGNTFYAHTSHKELSMDTQYKMTDFSITPKSRYIYITYNLGKTNIKKMSFKVYSANSRKKIYTDKVKKSFGSKKIHYEDSAIFDETKNFTIELQALEDLPSCNLLTHIASKTKKVILKPSAHISIEQNATHITGMHLFYRKNYRSNVTDGYLFIDGIGRRVEPKSFYPFISDKREWYDDSILVKYYVVNSQDVRSSTVTKKVRK